MKNDILIRKGTAADLDAMAGLEEACFSDAWSRNMLAEDMENPLCTYFVAEVCGQVVGYVGVWCILDEAQINNVAVSPAYRRQHIGTVLMEAMFADMADKGVTVYTLEVRAGNTAAQGLYHTLGFETAGIRPRYYADNGEDAILMWRQLKN